MSTFTPNHSAYSISQKTSPFLLQVPSGFIHNIFYNGLGLNLSSLTKPAGLNHLSLSTYYFKICLSYYSMEFSCLHSLYFLSIKLTVSDSSRIRNIFWFPCIHQQHQKKKNLKLKCHIFFMTMVRNTFQYS